METVNPPTPTSSVEPSKPSRERGMSLILPLMEWIMDAVSSGG